MARRYASGFTNYTCIMYYEMYQQLELRLSACNSGLNRPLVIVLWTNPRVCLFYTLLDIKNDSGPGSIWNPTANSVFGLQLVWIPDLPKIPYVKSSFSKADDSVAVCFSVCFTFIVDFIFSPEPLSRRLIM